MTKKERGYKIKENDNSTKKEETIKEENSSKGYKKAKSGLKKLRAYRP